jgi:hypothetical protein
LKKGEHAWRIITQVGWRVNHLGKRVPRQKWITFHDTRQQAEAKLADVVGEVNRGEFVEPSKETAGEWLDDWLDKAIRPPRRSANTYTSYGIVIRSDPPRKQGQTASGHSTPHLPAGTASYNFPSCRFRSMQTCGPSSTNLPLA